MVFLFIIISCLQIKLKRSKPSKENEKAMPQNYCAFKTKLIAERYLIKKLNIISFVVLFILFKNNDVIQDLQLDTKIKNFIIIFSVLSIYIYFAQISDLFEPLRNRSNTNIQTLFKQHFGLKLLIELLEHLENLLI